MHGPVHEALAGLNLSEGHLRTQLNHESDVCRQFRGAGWQPVRAEARRREFRGLCRLPGAHLSSRLATALRACLIPSLLRPTPLVESGGEMRIIRVPGRRDELVKEYFLVGAQAPRKHGLEGHQLITARTASFHREAMTGQSIGQLVAPQLQSLQSGQRRNVDRPVGHPREAVDRHRATNGAIGVEAEKRMGEDFDVQIQFDQGLA